MPCSFEGRDLLRMGPMLIGRLGTRQAVPRTCTLSVAPSAGKSIGALAVKTRHLVTWQATKAGVGSPGASADSVLAMDRLLGHAEQRADLGPA